VAAAAAFGKALTAVIPPPNVSMIFLAAVLVVAVQFGVRAAADRPAHRPADAEGDSVSGLRILIVDDEPQILRFLERAPEASGYATLHADTGRKALHLAANSAPDLVILDPGLPGMDGKEGLAKLRAFSTAPVIVLSASDREPTITWKNPSPSGNCWRACA
jgi:PleD family two-component response regulator